MSDEVKVEETKLYTLRELNDEDLYTMVEIIGAVLPNDAKEAFVQAFGEKKPGEKKPLEKKPLEKIGAMVAFDMVKLIMKNMKSVKKEVYDFLSDLSGIPADEIKKMPFGTTPKMLKEVFQNENNTSFFKEFFGSL